MRSLSKPFILFLHISTVHPGRSFHGSPDYSCEYCSAIFWYGERLQQQSSLSQHRVVYSGCYARGSVSLPIHRWHVSHNMHGKMQWTTMNSTGVDMCFVIVLNQRSGSSSSIKLLALQHVHDELFHAFRRWAIDCHSCVPQRQINEWTGFTILVWCAALYTNVISCAVNMHRTTCKEKCGVHLPPQ
jgi:hypothetical protein